MKKLIFPVLGLFLLVVGLFFLRNSLSDKGAELQSLEQQKKALESQLRDLENQIAQASSLNVIRDEATKMGMVAGQLYFLPPVPVALAPGR
uniref:Septum formation initiator family protein n=1 Tax=candidate division WWE3 bacterium TaxID=2053526 RepID=A0A831Z0U3_UNCKA